MSRASIMKTDRSEEASGAPLRILLVNIHLKEMGQDHGRSPYFESIALYMLKDYLESRPALKERISVEVRTIDLAREAAGVGSHGEDYPYYFLLRIAEERPDLIGFSGYVWNIDFTALLAGKLKEVLPETVLVLGGPEAHGRERIARNHPVFDVIVEGAGESPLAEIVTRLLRRERSFDRIPNTTVRLADGCYEHAPKDRRLLQPPTDRPALFDNRYADLMYDQAIYFLNPGCNRKCSYCLWNATRKSRRPDRQIRTELERIVANRRITGLQLFDDTLFSKLETGATAIEILLDLLRRAGRGMSITAFLSIADLNDPHTIEICRDDNIRSVFLGIQSTGTRPLEAVGREDTCRHIRHFSPPPPDIRRKLIAELIYPLPGDTYEGFKQSIRWCLANGFSSIQLFHLMVFAGSRMYDQRERHGIRSTESPPYYCLSTSTFDERSVAQARRLAIVLNELLKSCSVGSPVPVIERFHAELGDSGLDLLDLIEEFIESAPADRDATSDRFVRHLRDRRLVSVDLLDVMAVCMKGRFPPGPEPVAAGLDRVADGPGETVPPPPDAGVHPIARDSGPSSGQAGTPDNGLIRFDENAGVLIRHAAPVCSLILGRLGARIALLQAESGRLLCQGSIAGCDITLVLYPREWRGKAYGRTALFALEYREPAPDSRFMRRFIHDLRRFEPLIVRLMALEKAGPG